MKAERTLKIEQPNGNLVVELDRDEVIPEDPGSGCPANVYLLDADGERQFGSTYYWAHDMGTLDHEYTAEQMELTASQVKWLQGIFDEVHGFLDDWMTR